MALHYDGGIGTLPVPPCFFHGCSVKKFLESICGLSAGCALFAIMVLTFFDVSGRKMLSQSIPGSLELTEMLMVFVIFTALPMVSLRGEHVVFNSLDQVLGQRLLRVLRGAVHLLCCVSLLGLAWLMWGASADMATSGETSAQLQIPRYPFIYLMSAMCLLTGLTHLALVFTGEASEEEGTVL